MKYFDKDLLIGNICIELDPNIDHIAKAATDKIHLICTIICNSNNFDPIVKYVFSLDDFDSEKTMIQTWIKMILNNKLKLLVGWYLEFDYKFIKERCEILDIDMSKITLPTLSIIKYAEQFGYYTKFCGAVRQILGKTLLPPYKNTIREYALACCKYEFLILKRLNIIGNKS